VVYIPATSLDPVTVPKKMLKGVNPKK
jgi:hypothetical protein